MGRDSRIKIQNKFRNDLLHGIPGYGSLETRFCWKMLENGYFLENKLSINGYFWYRMRHLVQK